MAKYFFAKNERSGDIITLQNERAHHLNNVLRYKISDKILLCDGMGMDYVASLEHVSKNGLTLRIISESESHTELPFNVTLYQGLPKGDKMDWVIEKAVEIGVTKIIPIETEHSVVKIKEPRKKQERYQRIAKAAASQSMRSVIPDIASPVSFDLALCDQSEHGVCLVAHEKENRRNIKSAIYGISPVDVSVWIGPEGGFSEKEIIALENKNAKTVSLGPRTLRSETAGLVAISQIISIWDGCVISQGEKS